MKQPDNPEAELRRIVSGGHAVIVAGTGVSISASVDPQTKRPHPQASWSGLLENGLEWLKEKSLIAPEVAAAQLTLFKKKPQIHHFISAAEDVTEGMGGAKSPHFRDWLSRTIGSIKAHDRGVLDALEALRQQGNLLATTNYDGLLLGGSASLNSVTWQESDSILGAVRKRETNKVIFLHGYWRLPESVILDWKSYDQIARDAQYRDDLAAFWKTSIWVYVGCGISGLSDPDFGLLLERYGSRARGAAHWDFCLVRRDQREEFQAYFEQNQLNICAVSLGDDYDKLPGFLRSLLPAPTVLVHPPKEAIVSPRRNVPAFRSLPPSTPSPITSARTSSLDAKPNSTPSATGQIAPIPPTSSSLKPSAATARAYSLGSGQRTTPPSSAPTGPGASGIRSMSAAPSWRTSASAPSPT